MNNFANSIIAWYEVNKRDLPWRNTRNPYLIWLSEIILQQTRVKQGLPYYEKFADTYPTVQDLANANEQDVLRLWQGLGYYSRARNMHATAYHIANELDGVFPNNYKDLLKLKGVGKYTAAAIASFAFDEAVAVLDGNVFRLLARYFGVETDIASNSAFKEFAELAQSLLPVDKSATFNQAMMEFGAMQCSPAKPNCMFCPLQTDCVTFQTGRQEELPIKINKLKIKNRYFHYLIFQLDDKIALKKREEKDIWQGLYDFDLVESDEALDFENVLAKSILNNIEKENWFLESTSTTYKHILTHQRIEARFWHITLKDVKSEVFDLANLTFFSLEEIKEIPKPILIANYLEKHFF